MTWVALHEVTHAVQFAGVPWLHAHMAGLVRELLQKRRSSHRNPRGSCGCPPARRSGDFGGALRRGDLISIVTSQAERETLDRVQAVMAVIEGHAEHVMDAVAPDLLPSLPGCARRSTGVGARSRDSRACSPGCSDSSSSYGSTSRASTSATRSFASVDRGPASRVLRARGAADARRARGSLRLVGSDQYR